MTLISAFLLLIASHYAILHLEQRWLWRAQPALQLTEIQKETLKNLAPPHLEIYLRQHRAARRAMQNMLAPLQDIIPLQIEWINPDLDPIRAQQRDIQHEGQIYLRSGENGLRLEIPSLQGVVEALLSFAAKESAFLVHLQGHGERDFLSDRSGSWQALYRTLLAAGGKASVWTQSELPLPENGRILVMADPQEALPAAHQKQLAEALQHGMHLIYSSDSYRPYLPEFIKEISGLNPISGRVVSVASARFGLDNPEFLVMEELGDTALSHQLKQAPLLPTAVAFREEKEPAAGWTREVLFWSDAGSWAEQDLIRAETQIQHDAHEARGPLPLAYVLSRISPRDNSQKQYLIILGDSDAPSTPYFAMAGNRLWWSTMLQMLEAQTPSSGAASVLSDQFFEFSEADLMPLAWLLFALPFLVWLSLLSRLRRPS